MPLFYTIYRVLYSKIIIFLQKTDFICKNMKKAIRKMKIYALQRICLIVEFM